jgi:hypothetical protein
MVETPVVITRTMARNRAITNGVAVIAVSIATVGHAHATPGCPPAVILAGDPLVIDQVAVELRSRGIDAPQPGCPAEKARIERGDDAFVVSIVDSDGRLAERHVADVATAAAVIESFAAPSTLPTELPPPPETKRPRVAARSQDLEQPSILVMHTTVPSVRGAIGIAAETSIANDGSMWAGARAQACVQLGPVCAGGQARFASDLLVSGDAERAEATRLTGDLQLIANYPVTLEGWSIAPGIGIGVGWLHVRRDYMDAIGNDTVEIDAGGLRTSAQLTAALPLGRSIVLTLGAAVDLAPTAHTQSFIEETRVVPGEPRAYGRLQIGLELNQR